MTQKLSPTMIAHIKHGIGGADSRTLAALERRGLIEDAPTRPGYYRLTEVARCLRVELLNPVRVGWNATHVEEGACEHGVHNWFRWEWRDGESRSESEPVILETEDCQKCNAP